MYTCITCLMPNNSENVVVSLCKANARQLGHSLLLLRGISHRVMLKAPQGNGVPVTICVPGPYVRGSQIAGY